MDPLHLPQPLIAPITVPCGATQVTDPLTIYSADGSYGLVGYQRSDGQLQRVEVSDQSEVAME